MFIQSELEQKKFPDYILNRIDKDFRFKNISLVSYSFKEYSYNRKYETAIYGYFFTYELNRGKWFNETNCFSVWIEEGFEDLYIQEYYGSKKLMVFKKHEITSILNYIVSIINSFKKEEFKAITNIL